MDKITHSLTARQQKETEYMITLSKELAETKRRCAETQHHLNSLRLMLLDLESANRVIEPAGPDDILKLIQDEINDQVDKVALLKIRIEEQDTAYHKQSIGQTMLKRLAEQTNEYKKQRSTA
jgi:hypothetical protein